MAALLFIHSASIAQVSVVESQPTMVATPPPPPPLGTTSANGSQSQQAELFYQIQLLQQEVLTLRGMLEQQGHELKQLKQQRLDDYLDLDRRLSRLGQGSNSADMAAGNTNKPIAQPAGTGAPAPQQELESYRKAIDLVLKKQDYERGIQSLNQHLQDFPQGRYSANAQYWLGQIYLLKDKLQDSRQWFEKLINQYPDHRKAPEAKFKLGKVYNLMGQKEKARTLLEEVAKTESSAGGLAREYLRENFSS